MEMQTKKLTIEQVMLLEEYYKKFSNRQIYKCIAKEVGANLDMLLMEQAVDVANDAIISAVITYNPNKGTSFATYAWTTISSKLKSMLRDNNRYKRKAPGGIISIEDETNSVDKIAYEDVLTIEDKDISEYLPTLSGFGKRVTYYLMYGYNDNEIAKMLHCSVKKIKAVRDFEYQGQDFLGVKNRLREIINKGV